MTDLLNSTRRLFKATYVPSRSDVAARPTGGRTHGLAKVAYVGALCARPSEFALLRSRLAGAKLPSFDHALAVLEEVAKDGTPARAYASAADLAPIPAETLLRIGDELAAIRANLAAKVELAIGDLRTAYQASFRASATSLPEPSAGSQASAGSQVAGVETIDGLDARGNRVRISKHRAVSGAFGRLTIRAGRVASPALGLPTKAPSAPVGTIEDALQWAAEHHSAQFAELRSIFQDHAPAPLAYSNVEPARAVAQVIALAADTARSTQAASKAFRVQMKIEPVGWLHLERLDMTPVGIERGELLSSIPLTPRETVNVTHREWSVSTREFESIVQDSFDGFSEQGVTEKTDIAQSTESQSAHSSALNFGASATASYIGVTVSSSFGLNLATSDAQAQKDSRNQSVAATRKASARVRKDHKTSFRVTSVAGTEDRAVRVITNPSDTQSMRVDYYQLMRKWRVDLYRYGLRMTYDIVIPSPGADLIRKIESLASLDEQLSNPFVFSLAVTDVTRGNWKQLASTYDASIEPPPKESQSFMASTTVQSTASEMGKFNVGAIPISIDQDYELSGGEVIAGYYYQEKGTKEFDIVFDVLFDGTDAVTNTLFDPYPASPLAAPLLGRSGSLSIPFFFKNISSASINVAYEVRLRDDVFAAWQFRAWKALRDGAEARHQQRAQQLRDQRAALVADLAPFDDLTLRRMELEEIMKGVLRWLFGPSFNVSPADIQAILTKLAANDPLKNDALDPSSLSNQQWKRMMEFGEFIQFVHEAIEWENVLYFMYPYFWDSPRNWSLKQFLEHPDSIHRTFLRAGSARVVLTIRPGFEKSFAALIETGAFGQLPQSHPYVSIAEEIQQYAETNYPGIPPANPDNPPTEDETNRAERGKLMATWWEYTPTGALDLSINTAYPEMG